MAVVGALVASLVSASCSGSDAPASPSPTTASAAPSSPTGPVESPPPSPSGEGFCVDRFVIGDVYRLIRAGTVPYRQAGAFVNAAGKIMRSNSELVTEERAARKLRQFMLYLNTLRLAIFGAAQNYPEDFAVKQFTNGLVDRVEDLSDALDCPPA